ncbi:Crp/Fnr family transcriptional regulator [Streptococcus catagoni]|uniref:Crp/Fnr family transcriptional regulator n=1 Tax=Streptococcus catagoni TaxID=2654874 RepID=UPI00140B7015|nr:cyclic nucleotide-binding domain-containing protein [Streptococcus catagoni]
MKIINDYKLLQSFLYNKKLDGFFPEAYHQNLQLLLYQKGETICQQGQDVKALSYTVTGSVKITRRLTNGKEHILETHARPCIVGDIELMTNQQAVTSVIALEETYLIQMPLTDKENLLKDPQFLYQIGQKLADNFYQQNIRSTTNISYTVKERLASHILKNADTNRFILNLPLLADSFGTSYRHLHRVIQQLVSENIIERSAFKEYQILDHKKLENLASDD